MLLCMALVGFLLVALGKEPLEPNWTVFEKVADIDKQEVLNFLRNFPVHTYWDTLEGEYRTGAIGDRVATLSDKPRHVTLVNWVDKQVAQHGKLVKFQHPVIDTNVLFTLMLVAIQHLAETSAGLMKVAANYEQQYNFEQLTTFLRDESLTSNADTEAQLRIAELYANLTTLEGETERRRHEFHLKQNEDQLSARQDERAELHRTLLDNIRSTATKVNAIYETKWQELQQLVEQSEAQEFALHKRALEIEYENSIAQLEEEMRTTLAIIQYRADQELAALRLTEASEERLTQVQAQSAQTGTAQVLSATSTELTNLVLAAFGDPWFVISWGRMLIFAVVSLLVILEVSRSLGIIFQQWYFKSSRLLYSQRQYSPTLLTRLSLTLANYVLWWRRAKPFRSDEIVSLIEQEANVIFHTSSPLKVANKTATASSSNPTTQRQILQRITSQLHGLLQRTHLHTYSRVPVHVHTPLPHLLFYGGAGCGKSLFAQQLVHYCCRHGGSGNAGHTGYLIVSGADLEALGDRASVYLRDLFHPHTHSSSTNTVAKLGGQWFGPQKPRCTIVVIDEADSLIRSRDATISSAAADSVANGHVGQSRANASIYRPEEEVPSANQQVCRGLGDHGGHARSASASPLLYALLEALRTPSSTLSVILTTRLPLRLIDPALLDRYASYVSC